jgi:hypothetical protein
VGFATAAACAADKLAAGFDLTVLNSVKTRSLVIEGLN